MSDSFHPIQEILNVYKGHNGHCHSTGATSHAHHMNSATLIKIYQMINECFSKGTRARVQTVKMNVIYLYNPFYPYCPNCHGICYWQNQQGVLATRGRLYCSPAGTLCFWHGWASWSKATYLHIAGVVEGKISGCQHLFPCQWRALCGNLW